MSPRDFFISIIRIFAIVLFFNGIVPVTSNLFVYTFMEPSIIAIGFFLVALLVFCILLYVMIKKSGSMVDFLRLESNFEVDTFNFSNIESRYIVEIASSIIGIYYLVSTIPYIVYHAFMYFKFNINPDHYLELNMFDKEEFILNLLYLFGGVVLIMSRKRVSKILTPKEAD